MTREDDSRLAQALEAAEVENKRLATLLRLAQGDARALRESWSWRLTSPLRAALDAVREAARRRRAATVAVLVAVTSRGRSLRSLADSELLQVLVPSLLETASWDRRLRYRLYVGVDAGDPFYDAAGRAEEIVGTLHRAFHSRRLEASVVVVADGEHAPCRVWNRLFERAWQDGADFFYQTGDDVAHLTRGWTRDFMEALEGNPTHPGLGVTGAVEAVSARIVTQAFVSRVHGEVFGSLYPAVFRNWYGDDWITEVYQPDHLFLQHRHVVNNLGGPERYRIDRAAGQVLAAEVARGRDRLAAWLAARAGRAAT